MEETNSETIVTHVGSEANSQLEIQEARDFTTLKEESMHRGRQAQNMLT